MKMVNTAFICDDNYAMQTAVALSSMKYNKSPDVKYINYIIVSEVSIENEKSLLSLCGNDFLVKIKRVSLEKYRDIQNSKSGYLAATKAALLKFDLPNIIDEDKVLYLDGDIIVRKDLHSLYSINVDSVYAAVVPDFPQVLYDKPLFDFGNGVKYFNSGMMLLNLKKMRDDDITERLVCAKRKAVNDKLMDQNIFNIVFGSTVKIVSPIYNLAYLNLRRSVKKYKISQINTVVDGNFLSLNDVLDQAYIVHFSSKDKPWVFFDVPLADEWIFYFMKSPFLNIKLKRFSIKSCNIDLKKIHLEQDSVTIPVVLCSNELYLKNLSVTIQSIIDCSSYGKYKIYVLYSGVHGKDVEKIESMKNDHVDILFINIETLIHAGGREVTICGHFSIDMFSRWYIPEIFCQYDKILYLDCDVVCRVDIKKLYSINIGESIFGACLNNQFSFKAQERFRRLGISEESYINSGVLIINIKKFIEFDAKSKLFDYVLAHPKNDCPDQDAINVVCEKYIKKIDQRWNVQWHHNFFTKKGQPCFDVNQYINHIKEPFIIHYSSNIKPWNCRNYYLGMTFFWSTAKKTPFYRELLLERTKNMFLI